MPITTDVEIIPFKNFQVIIGSAISTFSFDTH